MEEEREKEIKLYKRSLRGKSENTKYNYSLDLNQFLDWVKETDSSFILEDELSLEEYDDVFEEYKDFLFSTYSSIKTINRKYNSVNAYLEFKKVPYRIKSEKIQNQTFIDDMLTNQELKDLMELAKSKNDMRTYALIATCFYTGARISEVLQLKVSHLGKDEFMVKGKGSVHRKVLICSKLSNILQEYYDSGTRKDFPGIDNLFTSQRGALTRAGVNKSFTKYGEIMGCDLKEKFYPHAIRHAFTKNVMSRGDVSYSAVKQLLGHALTTTDIYAQLSKRELLKILDDLDTIKDRHL
jgi:integrase/recombinase XerD